MPSSQPGAPGAGSVSPRAPASPLAPACLSCSVPGTCGDNSEPASRAQPGGTWGNGELFIKIITLMSMGRGQQWSSPW